MRTTEEKLADFGFIHKMVLRNSLPAWNKSKLKITIEKCYGESLQGNMMVYCAKSGTEVQ